MPVLTPPLPALCAALGLFLPGTRDYPGSWLFDPLGLSNEPRRYEAMRVREIKNGRLAMAGWAGFFAQAAATRAGPLANLADFLDDPGRNNVFHVLQQQSTM